MRLFYCIICFSFCLSTLGQKPVRFEPCVNLGIRNTGVMVNYRALQALDIYTGIKILRYNNLGIHSGFKLYPFKKIKNLPFYGGTPFVGITYNHFYSAQFNKEDSRKAVNSYNVPLNNSIIAELGYRYNYKPEKMFKHANSGLGLALSILYEQNIGSDYISTVVLGNDIDGQVSKINTFMNGGIGFTLSMYILIDKIK
jgi:hypothetical protein